MIVQEESLDFSVADISLLQARTLLRRVDQKFLLSQEKLHCVLQAITPHYSIVLAKEKRLSRYKTLYFDTKDFLCATEHHRGRRPRYKVRIRHYLDRELSFLEVKKKNKRDRTIKFRREIEFLDEQLLSSSRFLFDNCPIPASELEPSLYTCFGRITLIGKTIHERITCDVNLQFGQHHFSNVAIVEVKQPRANWRSPIMCALRSNGIRPVSLSKYTASVALNKPSVMMNMYFPKLRTLRNIENG